ncbi:MAG: phenylalanine--tRNA ligase subunit beta, partial [Gammaproteobacteria bacterium]|nr:phenylalanine--tRNA ligase subunit beta [Gammaproteobacteria bacterium]
ADCPRYQGRVIRSINPAAQTPLWMQERLRRAGLRSLGPVVDVTNYVLLEYGQPMHAFDLEKLDSSIIVRRAKAKEKIKLLDDSEIELNPDMLVIADKKQAVAFAGIMGGAATAVNDSTKHIFLECAFFNPDAIRGKARHYGMQTDSSYRFERGVDFHLQSKAMERATGLIQAICGGEVGPISESCSEKHLPKRVAIQLRLDRITRILGIEIDPKEINNILTKLGMKLESNKTTWAVTPPSHRFDIAIEADLIEEVGRIYGYDNIPSHIPHCDLRMAPQPEAKTTIERVREVLVDRGYQEAITYSFVDPESHQLVDPKTEALQLSNPISADMSVMRTSLWSSLLKALVYNQARQQQRIRLFEVGKTFIKSSDKLLQQTRIAAVAYGSTNPIGWGEINKATDFFDIKGDLEAILGLTSSSEDFIFKAAQHPALHPGQSAEICRDGVNIGWIGALHPQIQKKLDLPGSAIVFEIAYEGLEQGMINTFSPVSKFPSIRRDLALVVDENITAKAICDQVGQIGKERLKSLDIFDVYRGQGIAEGKKSIAITLTLQDDQQTLTDVEVDNLVTDILASLQKTTGATLRE